MGLLADLGIAPGGAPPISDIEKKLASGDLPPEGIHHAVLTQVGPIPNADGRGWKFTFDVIAGPGKGASIEEVLWKPKGENAKSDATVTNRIMLFGHRLGLLKKVVGADGKEVSAEVEGKHDFCDCLGATCFLEVKHQEREYKDEKSGVMKKIKEAKLSFGGLIAPDDKKIKEQKVATATTATAAAVVGNKQAAAAQQADTLAGM